ncbi:Mu transposase C-terminal domain-containing protein [Curtobacterium caseinilyticum]|uniref:DDE-type integrase/transposase/recombinase n=1 Tax=Curtobacterium caseinilyticum TaxID=3055137 RepID=A0ABT7TSA3_9MICO|nr:Mu transposase C-terminal domain-containing protein [Curtobacterium caseinilyticum]MDM7892204.1 DDE-type integrase/transposase/recombinase [Curtobacterium caseinilyticum]
MSLHESQPRPAVRTMAVGTRLQWFGHDVHIGRIGVFDVDLVSVNGALLGTAPIKDVLVALQQPGSNTQLWRDQDPAEILRDDAAALQEYREKYDIIHRLLTGLATDAPAGAVPRPEQDPKYTKLPKRMRALAEQRYRDPRVKGRRTGTTVTLESELTYIRRTYRKWLEKGPMGLVHASRLRARDPMDNPIRAAVAEFMTSQLKGTKRTAQSWARLFRAWAQKERADLRLPEDDTLADYISAWLRARDHAGGTAKSQRSAANRPAMSPRLRVATRAGELVLFDTTKVNVWVRNPEGSGLVRLELTVALDLYSRAIVGIALTHTTPAQAIALCLADVIVPKAQEALEEWRGDPPTPYVGCPAELDFFARVEDPDARGFLPETVHTDNGSAYVSSTMVALCAYFQISYEQSRAYTPTDKAQIERVFLTIKQMLEELLPGFLGGSTDDRGEGTERHATLTPGDYELAVRRFAYVYNRRVMETLHTEDDPYTAMSPMEMFEYSLRRHGAIRLPAHALDPIRLLPFSDLAVDAGRVFCRRLYYRSPVLAEIASDPLAVNDARQLRIYYDPTDMRQVYVFDSAGRCHEIPWKDRQPWTRRFGLYFAGQVRERLVAEHLDPEAVGTLLNEIINRFDRDELLEPPALLSTSEQVMRQAIDPVMRRFRERFQVPSPVSPKAIRATKGKRPQAPATPPVRVEAVAPATTRKAIEPLPIWTP